MPGLRGNRKKEMSATLGIPLTIALVAANAFVWTMAIRSIIRLGR
jgi:hypothetical protein